MNPEFEKWLKNQIFDLNLKGMGGGWRVIQAKYHNFFNWNWNDIIEWDE